MGNKRRSPEEEEGVWVGALPDQIAGGADSTPRGNLGWPTLCGLGKGWVRASLCSAPSRTSFETSAVPTIWAKGRSKHLTRHGESILEGICWNKLERH